ncbi:MAG: hypothetical protein QOH39_3385 [Verrucomicrobiota bacterium]|jgi:transcriptional regulator with XRE-family HTH domain
MANFASGADSDRNHASGVNGVDLTGLLGAAIRERRSSLQISQEQLALRAGLNRTYVSDVERGVRNPSIKTIEKIAQALDVPVVALLEQKPLHRK